MLRNADVALGKTLVLHHAYLLATLFLSTPQLIHALSAMKTSSSPPRKSRRSDGVGFRLKEEDLGELVQRAARLGVSRHNLGREYVRQMLAAEFDRTELIAMLKRLGDAIFALRTDVALSVEAILVATGHYSEEVAHNWVESQLRKE